jgi:HEAT repeat protein
MGGDTLMRHGQAALVMLLCVALWAVPSPGSAGEDVLVKRAAVASDPSVKPEMRIPAIQELGRSGDSRAATSLLNLLNDPLEDPGIRSSAARALADLGLSRREAVASMEKAYGEAAADENLRYTILLSLGRLKATESLSLFREALVDPDEVTRFKSAQALGELNDSGALDLLLRRYEEEKDRFVRAEIVRAVGKQHNPELESFLSRVLLQDGEALVRWNAALMLKSYPVLGPKGKAALGSAATDSSPIVRQAAGGAL